MASSAGAQRHSGSSHVQDYIVRLVLATHPDGPLSAEHHQPIRALGQQPARRTDAGFGGESSRAAWMDASTSASKTFAGCSCQVCDIEFCLNFEAQAENVDVDQILLEILEKVPEKSEESLAAVG